jgi:hypothetical protein
VEKAMKNSITEEMGVHEEWYKTAKQIKTPELSGFADTVCNQYAHDYGTVVHAVAAAAIAGANAVATEQGITGFQASAVMWEFIRRWMHIDEPISLLRWSNALNPSAEGFDNRTISKSTMSWLQEQAEQKLMTWLRIDDPDETQIEVINHLHAIVAGTLPFNMKVEED